MSIGEEYIKIQTCVLRVGVHCDGCRRSLKNVLKEIQGVYIVSMDPGLGKVQVKVTMEAEMSPEVLMKRLKKKGKIDAELVMPDQPASGGAVESVLGGRNNEGSGIDGISGVQEPTTVAVGDGGSGSGGGGFATPPPHVAEDDDEEEDDEFEPGGEEENEGDDDMLAENVAPTSNVSGGPQAPVHASSPKLGNAGVNGDAPATLSISDSRISGGVHPSTQPGGGQMATAADLAERMRAAMTAALDGPMGGGQNMGLYMGQFNSPYGQPPRPTSGPVNLFPDNSYQQQPQHEQLTPPMGYQHPDPAAPDRLHTMEFDMPQLYSHYPYADQAPRHKEFSNDFDHSFSDENTGSCGIM
ncbi:unnamed protein product [Rhodiola kirilowii]